MSQQAIVALASMVYDAGLVEIAGDLWRIAGEDKIGPHQKYAHFLTEWFTRLNNSSEGSADAWLANAIRKYLPRPDRKLFAKDPAAFAERLHQGVAKLKKKADEAGTRKGLFIKFMRHLVKIEARF